MKLSSVPELLFENWCGHILSSTKDPYFMPPIDKEYYSSEIIKNYHRTKDELNGIKRELGELYEKMIFNFPCYLLE
jgi:hypothetical protein